MPKWEDILIKKSYEVMYKGGEVRIQFSKRKDEIVPIIRSYPENQIICDVVKIENIED